MARDVRWSLEHRSQVVEVDSDGAVASTAGAFFSGLVGVATDARFTAGANRVRLSGALVEQGLGAVGLLAGCSPDDVDYESVDAAAYRLALPGGRVGDPGAGPLSGGQDWHAKDIRGASLELRIVFDATGLASVYVRLDGRQLGRGQPAFRGLPAPVTVLGIFDPQCQGLGLRVEGNWLPEELRRQPLIAPSAKSCLFTRQGPSRYDRHGGRRHASSEDTVPITADAIAARIDQHYGHWTQNPAAIEKMQKMTLMSEVPALQQRLTAYHGTRVPILVMFYLSSMEVGRLATVDIFWCRSSSHPILWRGIYCRDYCSMVSGWKKRCTWKTLHGRAGVDMCLYHMRSAKEGQFLAICNRLTAIPGRSNEELLESYRQWRSERDQAYEALRLQAEQQAASGGAIDVAGPPEAADNEETVVASSGVRANDQPWVATRNLGPRLLAEVPKAVLS